VVRGQPVNDVHGQRSRTRNAGFPLKSIQDIPCINYGSQEAAVPSLSPTRQRQDTRWLKGRVLQGSWRGLRLKDVATRAEGMIVDFNYPSLNGHDNSLGVKSVVVHRFRDRGEA
jgi:hypothetical protein